MVVLIKVIEKSDKNETCESKFVPQDYELKNVSSILWKSKINQKSILCLFYHLLL